MINVGRRKTSIRYFHIDILSIISKNRASLFFLYFTRYFSRNHHQFSSKNASMTVAVLQTGGAVTCDRFHSNHKETPDCVRGAWFSDVLRRHSPDGHKNHISKIPGSKYRHSYSISRYPIDILIIGYIDIYMFWILITETGESTPEAS